MINTYYPKGSGDNYVPSAQDRIELTVKGVGGINVKLYLHLNGVVTWAQADVVE